MKELIFASWKNVNVWNKFTNRINNDLQIRREDRKKAYTMQRDMDHILYVHNKPKKN